jgi:outer membrane protein OmpA-like peptidoglycan-associated protein
MHAHRPLLTASVCLLAGVLLALPASAAERRGFPAPAIYLGVDGGGNVLLRGWDFGWNSRDGGLSPKSGGLVGGRFGVHILPQLAAELEVAFLPLESTDDAFSPAMSYDIQLLFHILKTRWSPVVEGGIGGYHSIGDSLGGDFDPRAHIGLGVRGLLLDWLALRVDVRTVFSDGYSAPGSVNLEMIAGLDFFLWRGAAGRDSDGDGISDRDDLCPQEPGPESTRGCPDADGDGIADADDRCPSIPGDEAFQGCVDSDRDGVADPDDVCVDVPQGTMPDAARAGCPADRDQDGVIDEVDTCPDVPMGRFPDAARTGCPADRDADTVVDEADVCVDVPQGTQPDAARPGCPSDRDKDSVSDETDACPDKVGAPDPDPKRNGCPGLVEVKEGAIVILTPVYFATNEDRILAKSYPVLDAVFNAIASLPAGRTVGVEGHTDNRGALDHNMDLSSRRAQSVVTYLVEKGIDAARLTPQGFGPTRPVDTNDTSKGRANNRRVDFLVSGADGAAATP